MKLVPKEILMSHLQRSEGAEEVSLPIDFFRDLLYQAMPRTWVGLTDEEISDMFCVTGTADADINIVKLLTDARRIEAKLKEKNG